MKYQKETKIGILVITAIALLLVGFYFLKGVYIFGSPTHYYGIYTKINGLQVSNPVLLNGYKIGQVSEIKFMPEGNGMLLVKLTVNEELDIPKDSELLLKPADLLGSMQISLILGKSRELAQSGDTLTPDISADLLEEVNEQLRPIQKKAKSLITSVDSVLKVIETILNTETQDNLIESFRNINKAVANLKNTTYTLDTLMTTEKSRIAAIFKNIQELSTVLAQNGENLDNIIQNFSNISDSLAKADVAKTVVMANAAITEVQQIVEKINKGEGSLGMLINNDELYNKLESASDNLDLLMEDVRLNPNRYVQFSVFGRKNKSVELTRKELEELKEYVKSSEGQ